MTRVLRWAGKRPVTIRTFDAGGDKPVPGFTVDGETNPFLGVRGLRLSLARPEVFRVQLRALARAAVHGNLKVMLPMVTALPSWKRLAASLSKRSMNCSPKESRRASGARHHGRGPGCRAWRSNSFDASFFSIGSNDLTQYLTAATATTARSPI